MKAIRKYDGKVVDVYLSHCEEYMEQDENGAICIHQRDQLIFPEVVDWEAFRREAAKDILAALVTKPEVYFGAKNRCKDAAKDAVALADELVKRLKEKEEKSHE